VAGVVVTVVVLAVGVVTVAVVAVAVVAVAICDVRVAGVRDIGNIEVIVKSVLRDGFTAIATSSIVVVRTDIKVNEVITQLHIWQSPEVKQSILYIHKITNGTVIRTYNKYVTKPQEPNNKV
jgi:hypothetical protein